MSIRVISLSLVLSGFTLFSCGHYESIQERDKQITEQVRAMAEAAVKIEEAKSKRQEAVMYMLKDKPENALVAVALMNAGNGNDNYLSMLMQTQSRMNHDITPHPAFGALNTLAGAVVPVGAIWATGHWMTRLAGAIATPNNTTTNTAIYSDSSQRSIDYDNRTISESFNPLDLNLQRTNTDVDTDIDINQVVNDFSTMIRQGW